MLIPDRQSDTGSAARYERHEGIGSVSLIIPTKNRPRDLELVVQSLLEQSVQARQLVIVDQSESNEGKRRIQDRIAAAQPDSQNRMQLVYIRDTAITGGAAARNRAMEVADGEIWLFLDDDVYLERDFIEQLLRVYQKFPNVTGVSGIITNYPPIPWSTRVWNTVFVHGPFYDERQPIYRNAEKLRASGPIAVTRFGGGLMSFRADQIADLRFDENLRGVCDGEDVDFCKRLRAGSQLMIAPGARLVHKQSPSGRLKDHWLRREARASLFLFDKHWRRDFGSVIHAWWLCVGYGLIATVASLRRASLEPWRALLTGIREARDASGHPHGSSG